jgi:hypothetical protein
MDAFLKRGVHRTPRKFVGSQIVRIVGRQGVLGLPSLCGGGAKSLYDRKAHVYPKACFLSLGWSFQEGVTLVQQRNSGFLSRKHPWSLDDDAVAPMLHKAYEYTWPMREDSWVQSSFESCLIHKESIQGNLKLSGRVTKIAS